MIERVHEHIISELRTNTRTDTIFVLAAITLNLVILAINSAVAAGPGRDAAGIIVMVFFAALIIVVNFVAKEGLIRGMKTREKLLSGLLKMYKDQGVEGYYDSSLLNDYQVRYKLFLSVVLFTGVIAVVIPFIAL